MEGWWGGVPTWHVCTIRQWQRLKHGLLSASAAGRQTRCRLSSPEAQGSPEPTLCSAVAPGLGQVSQLKRQGTMESHTEVSPWPPASTAQQRLWKGWWDVSFGRADPAQPPPGPKGPHHGQPRTQFGMPTRCSWQDTKVWKPGDTPKPSWWM